jgi:alkaline phosphatase D
MKLLRRDFLKWSLGQVVVPTLISTVAKNARAGDGPVKMHETPSILQGATDDTKTQFSVVHEAALKLHFTVTDSQGRVWEPDETRELRFEAHPRQITKLFFSDLHPNEVFYLNLFDESGRLSEQREFQTLDLAKPNLRFALCSCMNEMEHDPEIWRHMVAQNPDVLFFLGDSVYADIGIPEDVPANPAHLWKRFCEVRATLEIYYSKKLIPIFATWDDHDFGWNDANSINYPFVAESKKNFESFFAQDESHCRVLNKGPGVSSAVRLGGQLFLLLDSRSFRLPRDSEDRYAEWGRSQEEWMLNQMRQTPGPVWMVNGGQIVPSMIFKESVSRSHRGQYLGILDELQRLESRVIFVSGDVHYSEISELESEILGYPSYELTSSGVHSKAFEGTPGLIFNKRRIESTGQCNYLLVDSQTKGRGVHFHVSSRSVQGRVLFQRTLRV